MIYSRGFETEEKRGAWIARTEERFPVLRGRIRMMYVSGGAGVATFRDPAMMQQVRALVTASLSLPGG